MTDRHYKTPTPTTQKYLRFCAVVLVCGWVAFSTGPISWNPIAAQDPMGAEATNGESTQSGSIVEQVIGTPEQADEKLPDRLRPVDFDASDVAAAGSWAESLGVADWLGPLAPLALSPFFGITCLSGMSIWGPDWMTNNALLRSAGPLQSMPLFFVFLTLTVLTSLPRLTKISKPLAQAADQLETYSVIVILLVIKFMSSTSSASDEPVAMVQLGMLSMSADALLSIAMVINVIVINSVKFFFEFLVWLTPIPTLDAIFEACNKFICACLMAVYAMSPTLATILNLAILVVAAIILRWSSRRLKFYRTMMMDPLLARVMPNYSKPNLRSPNHGLVVFPQTSEGPLRSKSRWRMVQSDDGLALRPTGWLPADPVALSLDSPVILERGWVTHTLHAALDDGTAIKLLTSRRFDGHHDELMRQGGFETQDRKGGEKNHAQVAGEFA